jgi:CRISPR/Cas system CMR subunit Cmr4 (Cas7 group RAMP superfamily)
MNKELEDYYNNFFELFRTNGWKQLMEELNNNIEQTDNLETVKDEQDLFFKKGQLAVFKSFTNLELVIRTAQEQAEFEEESEDDAI